MALNLSRCLPNPHICLPPSDVVKWSGSCAFLYRTHYTSKHVLIPQQIDPVKESSFSFRWKSNFLHLVLRSSFSVILPPTTFVFSLFHFLLSFLFFSTSILCCSLSAISSILVSESTTDLHYGRLSLLFSRPIWLQTIIWYSTSVTCRLLYYVSLILSFSFLSTFGKSQPHASHLASIACLKLVYTNNSQ